MRAFARVEEAPRAARSDGAARPVLPRLDPRLYEGTQDERTEVFLRVVAQMDQPFSLADATAFPRLPRRTVQRHLARALDGGRIEVVGKGLYRVVSRLVSNE